MNQDKKPAFPIERSGWPSVSCLLPDSLPPPDLPAEQTDEQHNSLFRRVLYAGAWCVLFYVGGCISMDIPLRMPKLFVDPGRPSQPLHEADDVEGQESEKYVPLIATLAVILSIAGSIGGVLPGTASTSGGAVRPTRG